MLILKLGGAPISARELSHLANSSGGVRIEPAAGIRQRLEAARKIVEAHIAAEIPVYGLNTGLGGNLGHRVPASEIADFQLQILEGRAVGTGAFAQPQICRAAFLARVIGLSKGAAGISPSLFNLMLAMAERDIWPAFPTHGSIGASDLVLGAHMGLAMAGRGHVWRGRSLLPSASALSEAGLEAAQIQPKDGLALANHSAITTALTALALVEAEDWSSKAMASATLAAEGYAMNASIFDERVQALRPAAGQTETARWFRWALEGSSLLSEPARSVQDALSFRVLAPLFGSARRALSLAMGEVELELNSAADNPAILIEASAVSSTPNFHTASIALALDALAIAHVHLATASAQRIAKLMSPQLSGLPKYLSPVGGASAGFMPMQKTAAALLAEIRLLAQPASFDAMVVSEMVEDVAPHTPLAARKLASQIELLQFLSAIEALIGAQAVDLRNPHSLGRLSRALHQAIRERVPMLSKDRDIGQDVAKVREAFDSEAVSRILSEAPMLE